MKTLVLVDFSHLAHRMWNTFHQLKTKKGEYSGVPFGVMRALNHLKTKEPYSQIVCVLDGSPGQRRAICPTYKASRSDGGYSTKSDPSIAVTQEMLLACGCVLSYHPDFEADDLIAMLCKSEGFERILIYSADKDFNQLVSPRVQQWSPGNSSQKGNKERIINELDVFQEWGVLPESLALYRSFTGDASDEIKGLPHVPRAPLQAAVSRKRTPEDFYRSTEPLAYFNQNWQLKLSDFREQCELNYLITKLPWAYLIDVPMQFTGVQPDNIKEIFTRLEFASFLKKFDSLVALLGGAVTV